MRIMEVATGVEYPVIIVPVEAKDFRKITVRRYFFNWKMYPRDRIFKLCLAKEEDILGLVCLDYIDSDKRVEMRLLAVSKENLGSNKRYDGIAGCLIAFACDHALMCYGEEACISLVPKTVLRHHYISRYGMKEAGARLYLDGQELRHFILIYNS